MQIILKWASFGLGSVVCAMGVLLTQVPATDHRLDLLFLIASMVLLGLACWMLKRGETANIVRNGAMTLAALEVLLAAYGVLSIVTY